MPSVPVRGHLAPSFGILAFAALIVSLPAGHGAAADSCPPPGSARYAVMEKGSVHRGAEQQPVARLLQEFWKADGSIVGSGFERAGQRLRRFGWSGSWRPAGTCRVRLERRVNTGDPTIRLDAEALLDGAGRPRYSLSLAAGTTITGIWRRQADAACTSTTLAGTVLSQQQGLSWDNGWRPNAVVQRETWKEGAVRGVALSSYAGDVETASYTGTIQVKADCLATVVQRDSEGVPYNYRAIVMADGSGYLYLQEDPLDLTIGWLERETATAQP